MSTVIKNEFLEISLPVEVKCVSCVSMWLMCFTHFSKKCILNFNYFLYG